LQGEEKGEEKEEEKMKNKAFVKELISVAIENDKFSLKNNALRPTSVYFNVNNKYHVEFYEYETFFRIEIEEEGRGVIFSYNTKTNFFTRFGMFSPLFYKTRELKLQKENLKIRELRNNTKRNNKNDKPAKIKQTRQKVSALQPIKKLLLKDTRSD
jgi:hypothetical protein